jgi:hypothetical protein
MSVLARVAGPPVTKQHGAWKLTWVSTSHPNRQESLLSFTHLVGEDESLES